jgi:hypothetical protein
MSRILAHSHTRSLNGDSNGRRTCTIARGRLRLAVPFVVVRFQPSVPRLPFSSTEWIKSKAVVRNTCTTEWYTSRIGYRASMFLSVVEWQIARTHCCSQDNPQPC